jgi:hypothetical protein
MNYETQYTDYEILRGESYEEQYRIRITRSRNQLRFYRNTEDKMRTFSATTAMQQIFD